MALGEIAEFMQAMKRVEIITDAAAQSDITALLDKAGVAGYTMLPVLSGRGERGERSGDSLTAAFTNLYVLTACAPEQADQIVERSRPILKRFGGVCLVSDCLYVKH